MTTPGIAEHPEVHGGVVVGDDGSDASCEAVRWAAQEAARRGEPLTIVRAWSMTNAPPPATRTPSYVPPLRDWEDAVRDDMARRWRSLAAGAPGVEVSLQPVHSGAAKALLEASEKADLVVVASRGRGGFGGLLLGSVAEQVVRHSRCPVTVVRHHR